MENFILVTYNKQYYEDNKDRILKNSAKYREKHKEEIKIKKKIAYSSPEGQQQARMRVVKKLYGLTKNEYLKLVRDFNGICGLCERKFTTTLHVDHDHKTEIVRGLLCTNCNKGLGMFQDSTEVLEKAIEYLKRFE